ELRFPVERGLRRRRSRYAASWAAPERSSTNALRALATSVAACQPPTALATVAIAPATAARRSTGLATRTVRERSSRLRGERAAGVVIAAYPTVVEARRACNPPIEWLGRVSRARPSSRCG